MITLFILTLAVVGFAFSMLPVITFALMLETCAERARQSSGPETTDDAAVSSTLRLLPIR